MKRDPHDRPAVKLREQFGIRVNRLDPDDVAELIFRSVAFGLSIYSDPKYDLGAFLKDRDDVETAAGKWSASTMPFFEMMIKAMPDFQMLTEKPTDA